MNLLATVKECAEITFYCASIAAVVASAWTYRQNSSRERSQWLYELYKRFWDEESLQKMRLHIDASGSSFVRREDPALMPGLDNYLNFFEFVAFRWKKKELPEKEIDSMFGYFLKQIGEDVNIREYLGKYGYEQLSALLDKLGYSKNYHGD